MMDSSLWREYYLPVDPWEQLVLWGKTPREVLSDMAVKRASWGERRSKEVVCVPCEEGHHKLCVKPCTCTD